MSCIPEPYNPVFAGLRIQRMPSEAGLEFGDPAAYPYMCVASPSCHDTSTTRAWYEEDPGRRQRFYSTVRAPCFATPVHRSLRRAPPPCLASFLSSAGLLRLL